MAELGNISEDTSIEDLRTMLNAGESADEPDSAQQQTEKPVSEAVEAKPEAGSEPAEKPAAETEDEPLPEGVRKRIAKETERAARAQAAIDKAISERKAKEDELSKLSGNSGSEPVKTTAPDSKRPVKPKFGDVENETWAAFQDRSAKYDQEFETWLTSEAEKRADARLDAREAERQRKANWDKAAAEHGAEFPALMDQVVKAAPQGLQLAISSLENWAGVAVHLAKNPSQLADLAAKFNTNQYQAFATLGRIEAGLKSAATAASNAAKPLPDPPATPGGKAAVTSDFDWEGASVSAMRKQYARTGGRN